MPIPRRPVILVFRPHEARPPSEAEFCDCLKSEFVSITTGTWLRPPPTPPTPTTQEATSCAVCLPHRTRGPEECLRRGSKVVDACPLVDDPLRSPSLRTHRTLTPKQALGIANECHEAPHTTLVKARSGERPQTHSKPFPRTTPHAGARNSTSPPSPRNGLVRVPAARNRRGMTP